MLEQHILRIKLFLRKSSMIFSSNSEIINSIFMKGNSIFSECALMHHLKMLRSVLQTATKELVTSSLVQHDKNEF